jgi:hypothetical protein
MVRTDDHVMRHCVIQHSDEQLMDEYRYYLLSATAPARRLGRATTDGYKQRFPKGALVVEGHYYSLVEGTHQDQRRYTLDRAKKALVWASSIQLVGLEMTPAASRSREFIMAVSSHEAALEAVGALGQ